MYAGLVISTSQWLGSREKRDMSQYLLHILGLEPSIKMGRYFYYIHK